MGQDGPMEDRGVSRLAWEIFGLNALIFAGTVGFFLFNWTEGSSGWDATVGSVMGAAAFFSFPAVGLLVASRQPRNAIGWILLAIGLAWELYFLVEGYLRYAWDTNPGSLWRPDLVLVLTSWLWVPAVGLMGTFLVLLFPDGRLPALGWRPLARLSALAMILVSIGTPLMSVPLAEVGGGSELAPLGVANPLGLQGLSPFLGVIYVAVGLLVLCIVGSAASLVHRFRRSRGRERLQLKWVAAAAATVAVAYLLFMASGFVGAFDDPRRSSWVGIAESVVPLSFVLIPVAAGVAILKHRLYDIDRIINRALVYGALTAALALVYVGAVVGVGAIVRAVTRQESNNLAVAASTLVVAGMFGPLRRGIQSFIDRRFYRNKYNAEQTLADFSAGLRDQVDLDSLNAELVGVVTRAMQPSLVSLWLKAPDA